MANVRIKDLPLNNPAGQSWMPFEVITSGVYTTSRATLSSIVAKGSNPLWQTASATVSALSADWQNNATSYGADRSRFQTCYSTTTAFSGLWQAAYDLVYAKYTTWDAAAVRTTTIYTTVNTFSGNWTAAADTVRPLSGRWESTYTSFNAISGDLPRKFSALFGNGVNNPNTITHNLNTRNLVVSVALAGAPYTVVAPTVITYDTVDTLSVAMASVPTSNQYRITIIAG